MFKRFFFKILILTIVTSFFVTSEVGSLAKNVGRLVEVDIPGKMASTHEIVAGPEGNMWVTQQKQGRLVKVQVNGKLKFFPLPVNSGPHGIAFDSRGRMWVTLEYIDEIAQIGIDGEIVARFKLPSGVGPHGLSIASGDIIWWTGKTGNVIGRLDVDKDKLDIFPLGDRPSKPIYIAAGTNGNMWFTELEGSNIGRITDAGEITLFALPTKNARPIVVFPGPGGLMWFTEERGNAYGTINARGEIVEYPTGVEGGKLAGAVIDADENIWLQYNTPDIIQRIALDQTVTTYNLPTKNAVQHRIAVGFDGKIWATANATDKVVYIDPN
jgi:virginiamycin B lyase